MNREGEPLDFGDMKKGHNAWKVKLRQLVLGMGQQELNADTVGVDNACALGKWIYGEGAKHATLAPYEVLRQHHARFHAAAGQVIREYKAGKVETAAKMIDPGGEFDAISKEVIQRINALEDALNHRP